MWQCETNPQIGTPESRLLETVEPLWAGSESEFSSRRRVARSQNGLNNRIHQHIKKNLRGSLSWWKVAPLFALPLSIYNLRHVFLICNRLLGAHKHDWIPQNFALQHASALCVLACANENILAAHQYFAHVASPIYPKMLNAMCELNIGATTEMKDLVQKMTQSPSLDNAVYPFLTRCLNNNSPFFELISFHVEISELDWRCALQVVGEKWSSEQRSKRLSEFRNAIEIQSKKYGRRRFLCALVEEMVSLKYRYEHLPEGWKDVLQTSSPTWTALRSEYLSAQGWSGNWGKTPLYGLLENSSHPAVVDGFLEFITPFKKGPDLLRILLNHNALCAAEILLQKTDMGKISIDVPKNIYQYPILQAWFVKNSLLENISPQAQRQRRKL